MVTSEANVMVIDNQFTNEASSDFHVLVVRDKRESGQKVEAAYRKAFLVCRDAEVINLGHTFKSITAAAFFNAASQLTLVMQELVKLNSEKQTPDTV